MKRIALTLALSILFAPCLKAQEFRNEFDLSYGRVSIPGFAYTFASVFSTVLTFGLITPEGFHSTGAITAGYWHYLTPRFSAGGGLTYEGFRLRFNQYAGKNAAGEVLREPSDWNNMSFTSLMPGVKYRWVDRKHFGMYTKANVGMIWYHNQRISVQADENNWEQHDPSDDFGFAFQLSLIGLEAGNGHWRGTTEFGWGMEGLVQAGVKYIF
ncbi:MAG: hypothetical protein MJY58_05720 [Bacteroidaceae bacterium]|nr:hypothetical protein [Bacteroidaceae bacterium]